MSRTGHIPEPTRPDPGISERDPARRKAVRRCDPVGAVEIAARLGVARPTVDMWRQRDIGFPEPRWTIGGRPAWDWPDVAAWAASTSRA